MIDGYIAVPTEKEKEEIMSMLHYLFGFCGFEDALKMRQVFSPKWYGQLPEMHSECGFHSWSKYYAERIGKRFNVRFATGATKLVIIPDNGRWVIKLPLGDSRVDDEKYFNELEAEIYSDALNNDLALYFAATYKIADINGFPIVLQEKTAYADAYVENTWFEYVKRTCGEWIDDDEDEDEFYDRISDTVSELDNDERLQAIFGYDDGNDVYNFLDNYCATYSTCMDLHDENYGRSSKDNRIVIIDYCGYGG